MREDTRLAAGDKIELFEDENRFFKTVVWEVLPDGSFFVAIPHYQGIPMLLHEGDEIYLLYFRDSGRYLMKVRAAGFIVKDDVRYARLVQITESRKNQRREYFRLPVRLKVVVYSYPEEDNNKVASQNRLDKAEIMEITEMETVETKNLSVTGIAIDTKREYNIGERFILQIHLDEGDEGSEPLEVSAEVMRISYDPETKRNNVGKRFVGQDPATSDFLARYVLSRQQKQIFRKRLIEDKW